MHAGRSPFDARLEHPIRMRQRRAENELVIAHGFRKSEPEPARTPAAASIRIDRRETSMAAILHAHARFQNFHFL